MIRILIALYFGGMLGTAFVMWNTKYFGILLYASIFPYAVYQIFYRED